jgi:hypothetical protein
MGDFAKGIKSFKKGLAEEEGRRRACQERADQDHRSPATTAPTAAATSAETRKVS